ncbi:MAG: hypothetical protein KIT56_05120 [Gammaproteobacteria bacterium]|nr:hypothetical protein [Gammaproteobacteria bacterium]MCW5583256.1 hypothetical protein [Gammaproteobacteria bacterium]
MKSAKKILIMSILSLFSITAYAQSNSSTNTNSSQNNPDIVGNYQCQGYDPFGKNSYANPVTITKNGDTYSFQWLTSKGYPFILGTGVFADVDNVISVVFWDPKKADYFGTEVFTIKPDGSMTATWTVQGENQIGTESCKKK